MYSYDTGASVIPPKHHIWIGLITFASDINPMNAELEIISIKNKYKRKLLAVEVLVIVVIVVVVVSDCSA